MMKMSGNFRILALLLAVCFAAVLVATSSASAAQSDIKAPKAKFAQAKSGKYVRIASAATTPQVPLQNPVTSNPAGPTSYCCSYPAPAWGTAATYGGPGSYCCTYPAPAANPPAASWRAPATSGGGTQPVAPPPVPAPLPTPAAQPVYTVPVAPYCPTVQYYGWPRWFWDYWY